MLECANLAATTANIDLTFYSQNTAVAAIVVPDTIPASGFKAYCSLSSLPAGFNGSAVISSDTSLGVVANVTNSNFTGMYGSYGGFSEGAPNIALPLLMKANYGYNTEFSIQNAGSATTSVTITYSDGVSVGPDAIEAGRAKTYSQASEAHANGWVGSASVSAPGGSIVAAGLETNKSVMFAYNSFNTASAATTLPVFPTVMANNFGYFSGINIQNTGGSATNVTVAYTPISGGGSSCTETKSIPAGGSTNFATTAWDASDPSPATNTCANGALFVGRGAVSINSASMPLVAVVNQLNIASNKGSAYDGFNPSLATSKVVLPLIMDRNYGFFTGFNLMNVGTGPVDVTCTYTGTAFTQTKTGLGVGEVVNFQQLNVIANLYAGSGTCVAAGTDPKIVAVVNQLRIAGSLDTFLSYEGFNN